MDKKGAKGYWISTAKIINQELFDEYVNKVAPLLKEVGGEVFAKDTEPLGKERTEDSNLAVICEFPSMRAAVEAFESEEYRELSNLRRKATENSTFTIIDQYERGLKKGEFYEEQIGEDLIYPDW
jgi:uncharacterized protein (DUF1330 family)